MNTGSPLPEASSKCTLTLDGWMDWSRVVSEILYREDGLVAAVEYTPKFPGAASAEWFWERGVVWNLPALVKCLVQPGEHFLIDLDDGAGILIGINVPAMVIHPDANHIVWEFDLAWLSAAFDTSVISGRKEGCVRLMFDRRDLEARVKALVDDLASWVESGALPTDRLGEYVEWPDGYDRLEIWSLDPDHGGMSLERLLEGRSG